MPRTLHNSIDSLDIESRIGTWSSDTGFLLGEREEGRKGPRNNRTFHRKRTFLGDRGYTDGFYRFWLHFFFFGTIENVIVISRIKKERRGSFRSSVNRSKVGRNKRLVKLVKF